MKTNIVTVLVTAKSPVTGTKQGLNKYLQFALAGVAQLVGMLSCKPKDCRFDSQSGHMPELWVQSQSRCIWEENQSIFLSLFISLPSCLSKNQ